MRAQIQISKGWSQLSTIDFGFFSFFSSFSLYLGVNTLILGLECGMREKYWKNNEMCEGRIANIGLSAQTGQNYGLPTAILIYSTSKSYNLYLYLYCSSQITRGEFGVNLREEEKVPLGQ
jgi:hypothetical protein